MQKHYLSAQPHTHLSAQPHTHLSALPLPIYLPSLIPIFFTASYPSIFPASYHASLSGVVLVGLRLPGVRASQSQRDRRQQRGEMIGRYDPFLCAYGIDSE